MTHTENTHKEGCSLSNIPLPLASCTCSVAHRENTKEKTDCEKYGHIAQEYDVAFTRCGVCDSELSLYSIADIKTIVEARVREARKGIDDVYRERNLLVQALSKLFPAYLARHDENDTSWDKDWMWIVYIDLPTGQVSWHIQDREGLLFNHLPVLPNKWDGHDTKEKYRRLQNLTPKDTK